MKERSYGDASSVCMLIGCVCIIDRCVYMCELRPGEGGPTCLTSAF